MTERSRLFKEYVDGLNAAGVRKTLMYDMIGASLKETLGQHREIRRAKVSEYLYDHIDMVVHPYELLVGSQLGMYPVDQTLPDYDERKRQVTEYLMEFKKKRISGEIAPFGARDSLGLPQAGNTLTRRFALISRDHYEANIPYDQLQKLVYELQEEFKDDDVLVGPEIGREVENFFNYRYDEAYALMNDMPYQVANHLCYDHGKLLNMGFGALRDQAKAGLEKAKADNDAEKTRFYEAAQITMEAAIRYIYRYADFVEAEAAKADAERSAQLTEIAARMRRIAENKPENFKDAIQLLWLEFIMSNIPGGNAMSLGRFDQYMYPFYKHDIDTGAITRDEAKEYIMDLWTKVNEPKMRTVISMILAGTTRDGKPGENELTPLCLEVLREMKTPFPNTGIRLRHDTPEWVYDEIVKTLEAGVGQPCIFNDDHWIPILKDRGYSIEDARDFFNMGCVEIMIMGKTPNWTGIAGPGFPSAIELVFNNGEFCNDGRKGLPTGELSEFDTFEKFLDATCKQMNEMSRLEANARIDETVENLNKWYDPFASCMMTDPLDRGKDMYHGGCRYVAPWVIAGMGLGTATDSLSAIKKFVYEDKIITLEELKQVLETNFEGREDLRIMFDRTTPTFGNDIEEVDEIARRLMESYFDGVKKLNDEYKDTPWSFITSQFSYTSQVSYGEVVGAMPNGRKAREPISDNAGPSQGKDTGGPTKLVNSMLKKGYEKVTGAYAFNMKFTPSVMKSGNGRAAMKNIIKRYFAGDGPQMQINYVDSKTLKEAQEDPKKHAGLIVRVAGFCEYFANLDKKLQNEIIERTEQGM